MTSIEESLGIAPLINAVGPNTRLGGGFVRPEVARAMVEASQWSVDMAELHGRGNAIIRAATGADAGIVTCGAAAALLLGTAACVAGLDPAKMDRLPDTAEMRNEVVIARNQRNSYDHAVRSAGVRLIEVGVPDRVSGPGVRDVEAWEYGAAIGERTAAVLYVARSRSGPPLQEVVRVAHAAATPVLVDAAAELPPVSNLRRFVEAGADLVAFSGGKLIGGPQASGILCGRRDLIASALLQQLDLDILPSDWEPPAGLLDGYSLVGLPHHGIGRQCKAGKEQIAGLLVALRLFAEEPPERRLAEWGDRTNALLAAVGNVAWLEAKLISDALRGDIPMVALRLDESACGMSARELAFRLRQGTPRIEVKIERADEGLLICGPTCLKEGDPAAIGRRLGEILGVRNERLRAAG
ncbi:MAG: aminotransferase class V-fold PLP-dependent enzyme [Acetobacteraceae bacterium]